MRGWLLGLLVTILPGCGVITADRPTVQQGNVLTAADLESLEEGLSRGRVRELLGTPVLQSSLQPDRWDYVYYRSEGGAEVEDPERLTLHFEGDRLARIVNSYEPPDPAPLAADIGAPAPEPAGPSGPAPAEGPPQPDMPGPAGPGQP